MLQAAFQVAFLKEQFMRTTHPPLTRLLRVMMAAGLLAASGLAAAQSGASAPAGASTPTATASASSKVSRHDHDFLVTAAEDGMAEVELGKLAQQKGSSEQVKNFGGQMVTDHGKAGDELKTLAGTKGVTLPTSPGKHQKDIDKLAKKSGADFDRDYARHMVDAHKKAVSLFQKTAKSGNDADVKAFAGKTLPTLQQHLEHANTLNSAVKSAKKAG
jgi:putative membrane protein